MLVRMSERGGLLEVAEQTAVGGVQTSMNIERHRQNTELYQTKTKNNEWRFIDSSPMYLVNHRDPRNTHIYCRNGGGLPQSVQYSIVQGPSVLSQYKSQKRKVCVRLGSRTVGYSVTCVGGTEAGRMLGSDSRNSEA